MFVNKQKTKNKFSHTNEKKKPIMQGYFLFSLDQRIFLKIYIFYFVLFEKSPMTSMWDGVGRAVAWNSEDPFETLCNWCQNFKEIILSREN